MQNVNDGGNAAAPRWGGARKGAGRKKSGVALNHTVTLRLSDKAAEALGTFAAREGISRNEAANRILEALDLQS